MNYLILKTTYYKSLFKTRLRTSIYIYIYIYNPNTLDTHLVIGPRHTLLKSFNWQPFLLISLYILIF